MLLECNDIELVILNLEHIDHGFDDQLQELVDLYRCVFLVSNIKRYQKLKREYRGADVLKTDLLFWLYPQNTLIRILKSHGKQQHQSVYITGNGNEIENIHDLGISVVCLSNDEYPVKRTHMPDHEVRNIADLIKSLKGETYGWFGELCAHGISGTGRFTFFPLEHTLHPQFKANLFVTGRYFTSEDQRAYIHPLTQMILQMKNKKKGAILRAAILVAHALNFIFRGEEYLITYVPPRPGKESPLHHVLRTATEVENPINSSCIKQLLVTTSDYKTQKSAGSWQNRMINVRGVFTATEPVNGHVILVDDIVTSGATAMECAKVLYEAGAEKVSILALGASQSKLNRRFRNMMSFRCKECDGTLKLRFHQQQLAPVFYGCSNYPTCERSENYDFIRREFNLQNVLSDETDDQNEVL